ncbi:MAG: hypothetical protein ABI222_13670 [Opitutaceae bacterium]
MANPVSTVRFASVVAKAGRPTPYLAWSAPLKDPAFKTALSQQKVMTIRQQLRGPHKDAGEVGYFPERNIQLLLFPKTLRRFGGKRIVGIDYALLGDEPKSSPSRRCTSGKGVSVLQKATPPTLRIAAQADKISTPSIRVAQFHRAPSAGESSASDRATSARPAPKPTSPPRAKAAKLDPEVAKQVRAALRELKTGNALAACARLRAMVS